MFSEVHFLTLVAVLHWVVVLQGTCRYSLPIVICHPLTLSSFSRPSGVSGFMSVTIMAAHLDAAQHLLIKTLLIRGLKTKLVASKAVYSVYAVQRIRLKTR